MCMLFDNPFLSTYQWEKQCKESVTAGFREVSSSDTPLVETNISWAPYSTYRETYVCHI